LWYYNIWTLMLSLYLELHKACSRYNGLPGGNLWEEGCLLPYFLY
jgi:hypothetical protein